MGHPPDKLGRGCVMTKRIAARWGRHTMCNKCCGLTDRPSDGITQACWMLRKERNMNFWNLRYMVPLFLQLLRMQLSQLTRSKLVFCIHFLEHWRSLRRRLRIPCWCWLISKMPEVVCWANKSKRSLLILPQTGLCLKKKNRELLTVQDVDVIFGSWT